MGYVRVQAGVVPFAVGCRRSAGAPAKGPGVAWHPVSFRPSGADARAGSATPQAIPAGGTDDPVRYRRPRPGTVVLVGATLAVFKPVGLNVLTNILAQLGIGPNWMLVIMISCLFGSPVNVPIFRLGAGERPAAVQLTWFGLVYRPRSGARSIGTVNVGGAIVPTVVAVYLVVDRGIAPQALAAIAVVTAAVFVTARPLGGVDVEVAVCLPVVPAALMVWTGSFCTALHRAWSRQPQPACCGVESAWRSSSASPCDRSSRPNDSLPDHAPTCAIFQSREFKRGNPKVQSNSGAAPALRLVARARR